MQSLKSKMLINTDQYKNYLRFRSTSGTTASVNWSVDDDGIITLNGTSTGTTSNAYSLFSYYITLPAGDYTFTSLNQNDKTNTHQLYMVYQDGSGAERGTGALNKCGTNAFTLTQQTKLRVYMFMYGGNTYNNVKMYPMIIKGTYTYETVPAFMKCTSRLPNAYEEVEYITSNGNQSINPNLKLATNSKYQFEIEFTSNDDIRWFGNYQNGSNDLVLAFKNGYIPCRINQQWDDNYLTTISLNQKHLIEVETNSSGLKIYCDGVLHKEISIAYAPNTNLNIGLLKEYSNTKDGLIGNLYTFKAWVDNDLVKNFYSSLRKSDNAIGVYDVVDSLFYGNSGSGTFNMGATIVQPTPATCYKTLTHSKDVNLLKLTRTEWNSTSYQPADTVVFDYNKLYYMAGSGYIRPYDNALNATITNHSVGMTATSSSWWGIGFPIKVSPSTKYTISAKRYDGNKTKLLYTVYNSDGTFSRYGQLTSNVNILDITYTITMGANEDTLIVVVAGITQGDTVYAYDIQVEEGQTATEFMPYGKGAVKSICEIIKYARLPSEYQEVEYLESSGTQYIDTGVNPTNDYGMKVVVSNLDEESSDFNYLGARTQSVRFALNYYQGKHGYGWGNFYTTNETFNVNEKTTVALNYNNSGKFSVNGNDIDTLPSTTISGLPTILIFAQNTSNGAQTHKYRIYNHSITNGLNLVRNFIPCYRKSDNVAGMYEIQNNQFYTNAGTGTFSVGGDIN